MSEYIARDVAIAIIEEKQMTLRRDFLNDR